MSSNSFSRAVAKLASLPAGVSSKLITLIFTRRVRFAGTGNIRFLELAEGRAVLMIRNQKPVQNHIGTVHAAAMALLAETATGAVFGMTVPDTHLPLLKTMHIDYRKRATGDLRAEATLSASQRKQILSQEKGEVVVPVRITDATGIEPIECQMTWAWVPKKRTS
jgi:acyl-coenzyme A thioesterase PaaI-like protein